MRGWSCLFAMILRMAEISLRMTYDPDADAAYIYISDPIEPGGSVRTRSSNRQTQDLQRRGPSRGAGAWADRGADGPPGAPGRRPGRRRRGVAGHRPGLHPVPTALRLGTGHGQAWTGSKKARQEMRAAPGALPRPAPRGTASLALANGVDIGPSSPRMLGHSDPWHFTRGPLHPHALLAGRTRPPLGPAFAVETRLVPTGSGLRDRVTNLVTNTSIQTTVSAKRCFKKAKALVRGLLISGAGGARTHD